MDIALNLHYFPADVATMLQGESAHEHDDFSTDPPAVLRLFHALSLVCCFKACRILLVERAGKWGPYSRCLRGQCELQDCAISGVYNEGVSCAPKDMIPGRDFLSQRYVRPDGTRFLVLSFIVHVSLANPCLDESRSSVQQITTTRFSIM